MTTTRRDIVSGAVLAVVAMTLFRYVSAFPVRQGQAAAISAGFYPRLLAVFLGGLAVLQIATAVVTEVRLARSAADTEAARPERMAPIWKNPTSLRLFLLSIVVLVVYPFLLRLLGFTISGLLFVGTLIVALSAERRRGRDLVLIVAITLGIGILTYVVFRRFLQIPFPTGIFGR